MTMSATLERDAFMPRRPACLGSGLVLAIIAHLLLVAALTFSVNWRVSSPEGVEAELWAAVPQIAAPRPVEVEPPPPPVRVAKPPPAPEPVKPPPKAEPLPDAQIAIEKARRLEEKRKKELAEQAREDKEAKKEAEKLAKQRKAEQAEKLAFAVRAKKVLVCGNAYLGDAAPDLSGRILPVSSQVIATEVLGDDFDAIKKEAAEAFGVAGDRGGDEEQGQQAVGYGVAVRNVQRFGLGRCQKAAVVFGGGQ